jgi:hypothetical protein
MATPLTANFIRGICGLSIAELPDEVISDLKVIEIAENAAAAYYNLSDYETLYYKGWKAVTLLAPSLYLLVPETIQDNFNKYSRFNGIQDLIDYAFAQVALIENPMQEPVQQVYVATPEQDPVTGEITR